MFAMKIQNESMVAVEIWINRRPQTNADLPTFQQLNDNNNTVLIF